MSPAIIFDDASQKWFAVISSKPFDRAARQLSNRGYGTFADHKMLYSWRKRSGYTNTFWFNEAGLELRKKLLAEDDSDVDH